MTDFESIEHAFEALNSDDAHLRATAIEVVGEAKFAPAIPRLSVILKEGDPGTRYLAASAIGKFQEEAESAVPSLLEALRYDDIFLRAAVTGALIKIGYPSVPGLTKALFDSNKAVRRAAAKGLGKIGSPRAVNALSVALKDADRGVRKFAAEALGRINTPEARKALGK